MTGDSARPPDPAPDRPTPRGTSLRRPLAAIGRARDKALAAPSHDTRTAALLGIALGVSFTVCFLTGLLSHLIQHPPGWFHYGARPAGLYRVTQGLHVATGTAAVPLLLAKLWTVYPHLLQWPPVRSVAHVLERVSIVPLVAGALFMLWTGVGDTARWYPYPFAFVPAHYTTAWITIGALVVHIGAKASLTRDALRRADKGVLGPSGARVIADGAPLRTGRLSRRGFLGAAGAGVGIVTVTTVGQTLRPLGRLAVLAPRRPDAGVDGVPVNETAGKARVTEIAGRPDYRLTVTGKVGAPLTLSLADLRDLPQHQATLPITCVEGWSANAHWRGVRVRDLLARARAKPGAAATVISMQPRGAYAKSELEASHAADPDTLLAMEMNGRPLALDHGFPLRLIAPNRPGVMQTKWVNRLEVT